MIDRLGNCPNCGQNWKDDDIAHQLQVVETFYSKSIDQIQEIARKNYGWDKDNPAPFSKIVGHEIEGHTLYQCPNYKCNHVFDTATDKEYESLQDFREGNEYIPQVKDTEDEQSEISSESPFE